MAKVVTDGILDATLDKLATSTSYTVCAGQPTSQADIAVKALATAAITGGNFSKAAGDVSGRKTTITPPADMAISANGTADHVAFTDGVDYYVTTCPSQVLTSGGTVTPTAHDIELRDPA